MPFTNEGITTLGELIFRCEVKIVCEILHNSDRFSKNKDFLLILNHLKTYWEQSNNEIEISNTHVIFVENLNKNRNIDSFSINNYKYGGLTKTETGLLVVGKTLEEIVKKYCDEYEDPFHWLIFNPINLSPEIDKNKACAELMAHLIIFYTKLKFSNCEKNKME
jgi:hypothetical protein